MPICRQRRREEIVRFFHNSLLELYCKFFTHKKTGQAKAHPGSVYHQAPLTSSKSGLLAFVLFAKA